VAALLLQRNPAQAEIDVSVPTPRDLENVRSFTDDERSYEDNMASIWRYVVWAMCNAKPVLSNREQGVLVTKVLQRHSWVKMAQEFDLTGKAGVKQCLQSGLRQLLATVPTES
jgi:hypothetical protein